MTSAARVGSLMGTMGSLMGHGSLKGYYMRQREDSS